MEDQPREHRRPGPPKRYGVRVPVLMPMALVNRLDYWRSQQAAGPVVWTRSDAIRQAIEELIGPPSIVEQDHAAKASQEPPITPANASPETIKALADLAPVPIPTTNVLDSKGD